LASLHPSWLMLPGGVLCNEDNLSECRGCTCKSILGDHWASWRGQPANIECVTSTSIQLTGTVRLLSVVDHSVLLGPGLSCLSCKDLSQSHVLHVIHGQPALSSLATPLQGVFLEQFITACV